MFLQRVAISNLAAIATILKVKSAEKVLLFIQLCMLITQNLTFLLKSNLWMRFLLIYQPFPARHNVYFATCIGNSVLGVVGDNGTSFAR